jgi:hypothetical protein
LAERFGTPPSDWAEFLVVTGQAGIREIPDTPIATFGVSMDGVTGAQRGI